jgi:hypothetical protein
MNLNKDTLGEVTEQTPERLIMGAYGEMSNRERAVRVYVALALAVPFANLLVTASPTPGRAVVALLSFGAAFAVGWRAGYETLHVGDRADRAGGNPPNVDESYTSDSETVAEEGSS